MFHGLVVKNNMTHNINNNNKWLSKTVMSILLALVLFVFVWRYIDLDELILILRNCSLLYLSMAFITFFFFQFLRTLRIVHILGHNVSRKKMFFTICSQSVANGFLPAGLGELVLIHLLKKNHKVNYQIGTVVVLAVRLLDVSIFVTGFGILLLVARNMIPDAAVTVMLLVTLACIFLVIVLFIPSGMSRLSINENKWTAPIFKYINSFEEAISLVSSNAFRVTVFTYTLAMWLCMYIYFWFIVAALQVEITSLQLFWVYILVFPVNLLPIKGVANIGTHEAAWFISLMLLDFDETLAANIAISSHALFLTTTICLGLTLLLSYILSSFKDRTLKI